MVRVFKHMAQNLINIISSGYNLPYFLFIFLLFIEAVFTTIFSSSNLLLQSKDRLQYISVPIKSLAHACLFRFLATLVFQDTVKDDLLTITGWFPMQDLVCLA